MLVVAAQATAVNATVLFPFFVDIAPDYDKGNTATLQQAGVGQVTYSSTTPSFYPKTFSQAVSFFKDTLPSDVGMEETKVDGMTLITYTSITDNNSDTIKTSGYMCKIYLLEQPDGSFHCGYYEAELNENE